MAQDPPPLIMGGKNEKHTLPLVARYATEWNCSYSGLETFTRINHSLDEACLAIGRAPETLRRSIMIPYIIGRDEAALQSSLAAHRRAFPSLPATLADWRARGFVGGTPAQVVEQLKSFEAAGVNRALLQHNDYDDLASLELLAAEVLPHFD